MSTFDSARVKFVRAKEHLNALQTQIETIKKLQLIRTVHEYDSNASENRWRIKWDSEPPLTQLQPIIGDILSNARACLEHIAFALLKGKIPKERDISWPIARTSHDWESYLGRAKGVPCQVLTVVKDYQPAFRSKRPYLQGLNALNYLGDIDKHRRLAIVAWASGQSDISGEQALVPRIAIHFGLAKAGAIYATLPGPKVQVTILPLVDISFNEGRSQVPPPVVDTLMSIVADVESVLTKFERRFP